ncbi:MAG: YkgJ family cysteine cluster protein [Bdellovibrionales bacterium]
MIDSDFVNYKQLLQKVDEHFRTVSEKYPNDFQCRSGCHSCCVPKLSVSRIEREYIKNSLSKSQLDEIEVLSDENPFNDTRCSLLKANGECSIYESRPIICRSHGAPIKFWLENSNPTVDEPSMDVCYLNFKDKKLSDLDPSDILNIDTLNKILSAINIQYENKYDLKKGERFSLHPQALGSEES